MRWKRAVTTSLYIKLTNTRYIVRVSTVRRHLHMTLFRISPEFIFINTILNYFFEMLVAQVQNRQESLKLCILQSGGELSRYLS